MPIKIDKAIEILELDLKEFGFLSTLDRRAALKLSIAGLKAILFARNGGAWHPEALLPDEQPEEIGK